MSKENQTWMQIIKPPKELPGWEPTGPTLNDLANAALKAAGSITRYVGGVTGKTVGNIGQVGNQVIGGVVGALGDIGQAESKATQPYREAALEDAWRMLQQSNYFFGMPYSTMSYKDEINAYRQNHGGALPPGPHSLQAPPAQIPSNPALPPQTAPVAPAAPT